MTTRPALADGSPSPSLPNPVLVPMGLGRSPVRDPMFFLPCCLSDGLRHVESREEPKTCSEI